MKKVLLFACSVLLAGSLFAYAPTVTEKVLKVFAETFSDAKNVSWSEVGDFYMVRFTQQGIRTTVNYDTEGNFLSSLRYYGADKLPVDIQCKLKKKYSDKILYGVTEYVLGDDINYFVKLEDKTTWTTVKVYSDRSMQVTEKYHKTD